MSILKKYIEYLKDNPQGYWFKRKLYGWGWTPAKWQGWVCILVFLALVLWFGFSLGTNAEPTREQLLWFFGKIFIAVILLIAICYKKGEQPKWQWGFPNKDLDQE